MGPVLVETMVQGSIADPTSKKLHPFFTKSDNPELPTSQSTTQATQQTTAADHPAPETHQESRKKRRKTNTPLPEDDTEPKKQRRKRKSTGKSLNGAILNHLTKPAQDAAATAIPIINEHVHEFPTPPLSEVSPKPPEESVCPTAENTPADSATPIPTQPKRLLKFNPKTGTFGSPPKPKVADTPSHIVSIKYGRDDQHRQDLGGKITRILEGVPQLSPTPGKRSPRDTEKSKKKPPSKGDASKGTHPFFSGKAKLQPEASSSTDSATKPPVERHTVFMSTPVSPKKPRNPFAPGKAVQFGIRSTGTKVPGAMHPLWPAREMTHVRGGGDGSFKAVAGDSERRSRKSKGAVTAVAPQESVLRHIVDLMDLPMVRNSLPRDEDNFTPVPTELRLPRRHFESGRKLQKRIRPQLQTRFTSASTYDEYDLSADELSGQQPSKVHPALVRLYKSLETQLSAYDRSCCENLPWVQKYAPTTAAQVLQTGKEALLLSQWLQALRVQSVDTGSSEGDKSKGRSEGGPKKKRKKNKLDGFLVDSDDEENGMDEISDNENDWTPSPGYGLLKKSVIRSVEMSAKGSKDHGRLTNAIILSGPHGCGKTAAVYSVAKELGFEVFEINSSSRRSGKDILEKVGDMTRNHLVQQNCAESTLIDADQVANDIQSGKQGMMTSFFKPKAAAQSKKSQQKKPAKDNPKKDLKSLPTKTQKQSLILLEEVDVLFEEDKQFWTTLMGLISQSKRPFIMTCNDENLVPIQSLNLHGIFRFSPAPSSLAVDLCILIAANEGHALQRSAVEALYCSRHNDLRATITELNYWCQIGVGDRRGGFDWFYLRWPKGSDLDESGDVVRVISEDTYQRGMGWIGRDLIVTSPNSLHAEEEAMRQAWDSWQLDMGDWCSTINMESWAARASKSKTSATKRSAALATYDGFFGAMSDADICSGGAYGTELQEILDPTLPELPSNAREDFILGHALLEADPIVHHVSPNMELSTSLKSLARAVLHNSTTKRETSIDKPILGSIDEKRAISILDSSFRSCPQQLTRYDIAVAFDPIAVSPKGTPTTHLDPSVFDRTISLIVLDIAPWIRGIVAYEHQLMQKRLRLSNLLSEGGKRKRMRNTRSAMSALEGGERRTTRRERHFGDCLMTVHVMRTGGEAWMSMVLSEATKPDAEESAAPSSPVSDDLS